jgi:hypothetical protein
MADWYEPTQDQQDEWNAWLLARPKVIRDIAERFYPWKLYRLKTTDQRVVPAVYYEDGTLTVNIFVMFNRDKLLLSKKVFGINPDDLEECDLPDGVICFPHKDFLSWLNMFE